MKVGIIRCMQTEDYCPGTTDFKAIREKTGVFEGVEEEIELIGFINCGGCPGKKVSLRIGKYRYWIIHIKEQAPGGFAIFCSISRLFA